MDAEVADIEKDSKAESPAQKQKKSVIREWIEAIVIALVLALIIRTYVVQAFKIPSGSMLETLQIGDHILVNKFIYRFTDIEKGDVIVFKYPKDEKRDFIKRSIGLPGDRVEIKQRTVYINNRPIEEPYTLHEEEDENYFHPRDNFGPITIPDGKLFVMGDNRENSMDSRFWGLLDIEKVKGRAFVIYWSWDRTNFKVRWRRLGMNIH